MSNQLQNSMKGPEKFPLHQMAVILCSRCKVRYQPTLRFSHGLPFKFLICPSCLCRIPVETVGALAPDREGRGKGTDSFSIPLTPNHDTNQQLHI